MTMSRRTFMTSSATGLVASALAAPTLISANQTASPASATPSTINPDIDDVLLAAMEEHGIPGALVLVDSPETGKWSSALGVADISSGAPMTTDMHMRIGSITKTFTSTMVLQLIDQGALTLSDTLASLDPDLDFLQNADAITIRHLLSMQSGLPDYVQTDPVVEASVNPDPDRVYTPDELLGYIADVPAEFTPGEDGMYSNTNYLVLSVVAEHLTGTPWRELIQTGILDEVGLADTSLPETPALPDPAPRGYAYALKDALTATSQGTPVLMTPESATPVATDAPVDVTAISPSLSNAAGSMVSTLDDLYTWMSTLLEGTLLSPDLQADRMDFSDETDIQGAVATMKYGLGISDVNGAIGHDGGIEGFRSSMFSTPETGTTIITLANILPTRDGSDPAAVLMEAALGA